MKRIIFNMLLISILAPLMPLHAGENASDVKPLPGENAPGIVQFAGATVTTMLTLGAIKFIAGSPYALLPIVGELYIGHTLAFRGFKDLNYHSTSPMQSQAKRLSEKQLLDVSDKKGPYKFSSYPQAKWCRNVGLGILTGVLVPTIAYWLMQSK